MSRRRTSMLLAALLVAATMAFQGSAVAAQRASHTAHQRSPATAKWQRLPARFFGIVPQTKLEPTDVAYMRAGRIGRLRTPVDWSLIQPKPGEYDWYGLDSAVRLAAQEGIEVLPYIYGTPSWVASRPTTLPVGSSAQRSAWTTFVQAAVRRYGPAGVFWSEHGPGTKEPVPRVPIHIWQIWNEPNFFYFATPASPKLYGRLLKLSSRAIRQIDKRAKILIGGLFGRPKGHPPRSMAATDFLAGLYRFPGISHFFDGVALHPYAARIGALSSIVWQVRRVIMEDGDLRTGLYITEMGWGSQNNFNQVAFEVGRSGQARELRDAYGYLIERRNKLNLKGLYWFSWRDATPEPEAPVCNFCDSAGFFEAGDAMRAKPAWRAFVQITRGRPHPLRGR